MDLYRSKAEFVLKHLWFAYAGARYEGRGVITWDPEHGFHIEAFLERLGPTFVGAIKRPTLRMKKRSDFIAPRFRTTDGQKGLIPFLFLRHDLDLLSHRRLTGNFGRLLFFDERPQPWDADRWWGTAHYRVDGLVLPGGLKTVEHLDGEERGWSESRAALRHTPPDSGGYEVRAKLLSATTLQLEYALPISEWSKAEGWRWGEAAATAFSMLSGQAIQLHDLRFSSARREYQECRWADAAHDFSIVSPFGELRPIPADLFIRLTEFLARNSHEGYVCRQVRSQLEEAGRQRNWQVKELLVGTTLEAMLRTLFRIPYQASPGAGFVMRNELDRFAHQYLTPAWDATIRRVLDTWKELRHRNAHPDWLHQPSDPDGDADDALDRVIFLSRFYGYCILALAGVGGLQPNFPRSVREWTGGLTVTFLPPKEGAPGE